MQWKKRLKSLTSLHLLVELAHIVRANILEESDVIIAVIFGHLFLVSFVWSLEEWMAGE